MAGTFTFKPYRQKEGKINRTHLVSFSNGRIEPSSKDITFEAYENATTSDGFQRKKVRKLLAISTDHLEYSGSNFESLIPGADQNTFYIGCFKRKKNEMKIYPADIFRCGPVFENKLPAAEEEGSEKKNYIEKVDELTQAFGSKNKKRAVKTRVRHKVDNTDMEDAVIEALEESYITTKASAASNVSIGTSSGSSDICPPRNNDATSEDEVYNLFDIISEGEYEEIEPQANVLLNATVSDLDVWEKDALYSKFVINYLKDNAGNISLEKAKILAYYDYVVKFSKLRYAELRRRDIAPGIPNPFKDMLTKKFVVTSVGFNNLPHKVMSPKMKDKLIAHALVLVLFVEDFTVDLSAFLSDYNVKAQKIIKIAYSLGCHVLTRKVNAIPTKVIVLKLPLYAPKEKPVLGRKLK